MRVLITGGLGWLGKALTEVVSQHHTVRVFDLESAEAPRQELDFDGEVIFGSVTDYEARAVGPLRDRTPWFTLLWPARFFVAFTNRTIRFPRTSTGAGHLPRFGSVASWQGVRRVIQIAAAETHVDHPPGTYVDRNTPYAGVGSIYDLTKRLQEEICRWFVQLYGLNVISLRLGDILDLERGMSKHGDEAFHQAIANESWVHRYDVGQACLQALGIPHQGHDVFHLIGAPSARKRFDVARAESVLDIKFTTGIRSKIGG